MGKEVGKEGNREEEVAVCRSPGGAGAAASSPQPRVTTDQKSNWSALWCPVVVNTHWFSKTQYEKEELRSIVQ